MAEKKLNVIEKLILAKHKFSETEIRKSGVNPHSEFEFYQLQDIVPVAIHIFTQVGLLSTFSIVDGNATLTIINSDNKEDFVSFSAPFEVQDTIMSRSGKAVTNKVQNVGSSITYYRRYLWMMALDVVDRDEIDQNAGIEPSVHTKKIPVTSEERVELKKELTGAMDKAPENMVLTLKKLCKDCMDFDKNKVREIVEATDNFANVTKKQCEEYIIEVSDIVEGANEDN